MFCKCGCGIETRIATNNNKQRGWIKGKHIDFIQGHNSKINHPMLGKKQSEHSIEKMKANRGGFLSGIEHPMFGKTHTPEVRKKLSESHRGKKQSAELIAKRVAGRAGYKHSLKTLKKIGDGNRGKKMTAEAVAKMINSKKGKRCSRATEFTSERMKALHRDPLYMEKIQKALNIKPNKPETAILNMLNSLYPGEWKYTGDFSFIINGKNPDFVNVNGQKKIIELFGDYWHRGQDPEKRANIFKPYGYETLVIWEHELKDINSTIKKICAFAEAPHGR